MIVGLMAANAMGVRSGATIQIVTVLAKLATLVLVVCLALWSSHTAIPAAPSATQSAYVHPLVRVFAGLVPVLFSFGGWQQALWIGGEVREPTKNVPRAIIVGVLCVDQILTGVVLIDSCFFLLTGLALIILRHRRPDAERPICVSLYPIVPI